MPLSRGNTFAAVAAAFGLARSAVRTLGKNLKRLAPLGVNVGEVTFVFAQSAKKRKRRRQRGTTPSGRGSAAFRLCRNGPPAPLVVIARLCSEGGQLPFSLKRNCFCFGVTLNQWVRGSSPRSSTSQAPKLIRRFSYGVCLKDCNDCKRRGALTRIN